MILLLLHFVSDDRRRQRGHVWLALGCLLTPTLICHIAGGQSVTIIPPALSSATNLAPAIAPAWRVPTDIHPLVAASESALSRPTPLSWRESMALDRLFDRFDQAGIPVVLHESARDHNLDADTDVRLALQQASIGDNLRFALAPYGCDYSILSSGQIVVATDDYLIENPHTVVFDISAMKLNADDVTEMIEDTVDPDSWEANGGWGRMRYVTSHSKTLLVVTTTWRNVCRTRSLLESVSRMADGAMGSFAPADQEFELSRPVAVPEEYERFTGIPGRSDRSRSSHDGYAYRNRSRSGSRGGGGFGGGVF